MCYNDLTESGYYERAHKHLNELRIKQHDKCLKCNKEIDVKNRRKYQIHHIDEDISNNNIKNLALLCTSCHRIIHWENGSHPRHYDGRVKKSVGFSTEELKGNGIYNHKIIKKWEDIKETPGAVYKGLGFGVIKSYHYLVAYGHTLQEFAAYFNVSRQRVEQLMKKNSPRIAIAKEALDTGIDKTPSI
jgi:hypothetical protein